MQPVHFQSQAAGMICHHVSRIYVHHLELDRRLSTIYHGILRLDPPSMIFGRRLQLHRPSIIYYESINDLWPTFATTSTINNLQQILSTASNINDSPQSVRQFLPLELKHGEKIIPLLLPTAFATNTGCTQTDTETQRHTDTHTRAHTSTHTHEHKPANMQGHCTRALRWAIESPQQVGHAHDNFYDEVTMT
jgi:hypothetical protein